MERDSRSQPPRRDAVPTRRYHTAIMTFLFLFSGNAIVEVLQDIRIIINKESRNLYSTFLAL